MVATAKAFTPKRGLTQECEVTNPIHFSIAEILDTSCGVKFKYAEVSQVLVTTANQEKSSAHHLMASAN